MDMELGTLVHDGLARVLKSRTLDALDDCVAGALGAYRTKVPQIGFGAYSPQDQMDLGEALIRGWCYARLPYYRENYDIHVEEIERERDIPLGDDIELMVRTDVRVTRKSDGDVFAGPEFKTTGYLNQDYLDQWQYAAQVAAELTDEESGVLLEFLYKGKRQEGRILSPLIKGKLPTVSVREHLAGLKPEVILGQFSGKEVYRSPAQVRRWLNVQKTRQEIVMSVLRTRNDGVFSAPSQDEIDEVFPPRLDSQCKSDKYHKECMFLRHCWGATSIESGLEYGIWKRRVPHHPVEAENFIV